MANTKFKKALAAKIEAAQEATNKANEKVLDKLLGNEKFIEAQRVVTAKTKELAALSSKLLELNMISPFIAGDGRKFSVNVFALNIFGTGVGAVMGIIQGSRSAFSDEKALEYSIISGISILELQEAQTAMGSPAFYKDGKVHDAIPGNYNNLRALLENIFITLDLSEFKASDVTKDKYDLWFATAEVRANKQLQEHTELQILEENAKDFIIED